MGIRNNGDNLIIFGIGFRIPFYSSLTLGSTHIHNIFIINILQSEDVAQNLSTPTIDVWKSINMVRSHANPKIKLIIPLWKLNQPS